MPELSGEDGSFQLDEDLDDTLAGRESFIDHDVLPVRARQDTEGAVLHIRIWKVRLGTVGDDDRLFQLQTSLQDFAGNSPCMVTHSDRQHELRHVPFG